VQLRAQRKRLAIDATVKHKGSILQSVYKTMFARECMKKHLGTVKIYAQRFSASTQKKR